MLFTMWSFGAMSAVLLRAGLLLGTIACASIVQAGGIGVVGDSYSDEYQFYPPDRGLARNWVEFLASSRGLDFGAASTTGRGEPRNQGFAYNWARSGATTEDLEKTGQVAGVIEQVSRGEVDLVVMFIGGNDFINALDFADAAESIAETTLRAIDNLRRASEAILAARPDVKLLLVTIPDIRDLPEIREAVRAGRLTGSIARSAERAVGEFNTVIRRIGRENPRVAVADFDLQSRAAKAIGGDVVSIDGRKFVRTSTGDDPDHFFLADGRHMGTVGQGLLARLIVDTINARFQMSIPRIVEPEILRFAQGLDPLRDVVRASATIDPH
jgi:phospholipase/lecithinase/hemolysin